MVESKEDKLHVGDSSAPALLAATLLSKDKLIPVNVDGEYISTRPIPLARTSASSWP